jgi:hypothetical protein
MATAVVRSHSCCWPARAWMQLMGFHWCPGRWRRAIERPMRQLSFRGLKWVAARASSASDEVFSFDPDIAQPTPFSAPADRRRPPPCAAPRRRVPHSAVYLGARLAGRQRSSQRRGRAAPPPPCPRVMCRPRLRHAPSSAVHYTFRIRGAEPNRPQILVGVVARADLPAVDVGAQRH